MSTNDHIYDFLRYFIGYPRALQYAVLVNGPWGIGKTTAIKKLSQSFPNDIKIVYVSLNGVDSISMLDSAVFLTTYHYLDNKAAKLAGRALQAALKYAKIDIKIDDLANKTDADVLIFDDLERCLLSV